MRFKKSLTMTKLRLYTSEIFRDQTKTYSSKEELFRLILARCGDTEKNRMFVSRNYKKAFYEITKSNAQLPTEPETVTLPVAIGTPRTEADDDGYLHKAVVATTAAAAAAVVEPPAKADDDEAAETDDIFRARALSFFEAWHLQHGVDADVLLNLPYALRRLQMADTPAHRKRLRRAYKSYIRSLVRASEKRNDPLYIPNVDGADDGAAGGGDVESDDGGVTAAYWDDEVDEEEDEDDENVADELPRPPTVGSATESETENTATSEPVIAYDVNEGRPRRQITKIMEMLNEHNYGLPYPKDYGEIPKGKKKKVKKRCLEKTLERLRMHNAAWLRKCNEALGLVNGQPTNRDFEADIAPNTIAVIGVQLPQTPNDNCSQMSTSPAKNYGDDGAQFESIAPRLVGLEIQPASNEKRFWEKHESNEQCFIESMDTEPITKDDHDPLPQADKNPEPPDAKPRLAAFFNSYQPSPPSPPRTSHVKSLVDKINANTSTSISTVRPPATTPTPTAPAAPPQTLSPTHRRLLEENNELLRQQLQLMREQAARDVDREQREIARHRVWMRMHSLNFFD